MARAHGTRTKFVHDGCTCLPCRAANAEYASANNRARQQGRVDLVDARPAREHIRALAIAGVGSRRVAELSGLGRTAVCKIERGTTTRVRSATAAAILAVEPDRADGCAIDGTGTRRRLRALVALGWTQARLADALGWTPSNFTRLIADDVALVVPRTAEAVSDLYDRLWSTEPTCSSPQQLGGRNRARRYAAENSWVAPIYWDDDEIDDPDARPVAFAVESRRGVDLDEVAFLRSQGVSLHEIAQRMGIAVESIERAQQRAAA